MALSKPGWLKDFLDAFGWNRGDWVNVSIPVFLGVDIDIRVPPFSFHPGDYIETAIDFIVTGLNLAIDGVYEFILLVTKTIGEVKESVSNVIDWALGKFADLWDEAGNLWNGIAYAVELMNTYVDTAVDAVYDTIYSFVTGAVDTVREEIVDLAGATVDAAIGAIREQINLVVSFGDDIRELFADPEEYILNKLENALDRFW